MTILSSNSNQSTNGLQAQLNTFPNNNNNNCDVLSIESLESLPMELTSQAVTKVFSDIEITDCRQPGKVKYPLKFLLFCICLGWLCGFRSALSLGTFAKQYFSLLISIYPVPGLKQAPSHDTFLSTLANVCVSELHDFLFSFANMLMQLYEMVKQPGEYQQVCADGQCVKGSRERVQNDQQRTFFVTLYNPYLNQTIHQKRVLKKSNEIPTLQRIIRLRDLTEVVISGDAMHAQYNTALLTSQKNGYFLLQVKDNQPALKDQIARITSEGNGCTLKNKGGQWSMVEKRGQYEVISNEICVSKASALVRPTNDKRVDANMACWANLSTYVLKIVKTIERRDPDTGKSTVSEEISFGITNIPCDESNVAETLYRYRRQHWAIENQLHWCLDVNLQQDSTLCIKNTGVLESCVLLNKFADNVYSFAQRLENRIMPLAPGVYIKDSLKVSKRAVQKLCGNPMYALYRLGQYVCFTSLAKCQALLHP